MSATISIALGLARFVPLAAKWLIGEKAGEAAQEVLNIAEKVTGRTGTDAEKALAADPALQLEFKKAVLANEASLDGLYLKDRQDARARDVELKKNGYKNKRADFMIAVVGVALVVVVVLLWHNPDIPSGIVAIFNMMVGACLKMLGDAFNFEFGSSRGSKEKDLLLKDR